MFTPLKPPRGNAAAIAAHTGVEGSIVVNLDKKTIHVHDGSTPGGFALSKEGHLHTLSEIVASLGYTPIDASTIGQVNGVAGLDATGKVPAAQLPAGMGGGVSDAADLTGDTLADNVLHSSLTSVGTLQDLTVTNTIAGSVSGTAGKLAAPRNISLAGDATGSVAFDGSQDAEITVVMANVNSAPVADGLVKVTTNAKGLVVETTPVDSDDLINALGFTPVSKSYVDDVAAGMVARSAVRTATTGALTATYNNGTGGNGATLTGTGSTPTIGGITPSLNDRVLVKDQPVGLQNGPYILTAGNPWVLTRADDVETLTAGSAFYVQEGTLQGSRWAQTTVNPVVGSTSVDYTQVEGGATLTQGAGISIVDNVVTNTGVRSLAGTPNQINVSTATGTPTLSLAPSISLSGTVTANAFSGNGSALTNLNASNLASGMIPTARMGSGTASATTFLSGDGTWKAVTANVTALNATAAPLVSGTSGVYAGFTSYPLIRFVNSAGSTGNKAGAVYLDPSNSSFNLSFVSDDLLSQTPFMTALRNGKSATNVTFTSTAITLQGAVSIAGTLNVSSVITGNGSGITALNATNLSSGYVPTARLGSGTASSTTALFGDGTWKTINTGAANVLTGTGAIARSTATSGVYAGVDNSGTPLLTFTKSDGAAGQKAVQTGMDADGTYWTALANDAINSQSKFFSLSRSGNTATSITWTTTSFVVAGGFTVNGGTATAQSFIPTSATAPTNGLFLPAAGTVGLASGGTESVRWNTAGAMGLAGGNFGNSGQVLTSQGSGAAPIWTSVSADSVNATAVVAAVQTTTPGIFGGVTSSGSNPVFNFIHNGASVNTRVMYQRLANTGIFDMGFTLDNGTSATSFLSVSRSTGTVNANAITFTSTSFTVNAAATMSSLSFSGSTRPTNGFYLPAANTVGLATKGTDSLYFNANGAIGLGGANYGTVGQVLTSNGTGTPTWTTPSAATSNALNGTATPSRTGATSGAWAGADANGQGLLSLTNASNGTNTRASTIYYANDTTLRWDFSNDTFTTGTSWMIVSRSGNTASDITFASTAFNLNVGTGGFKLNGSAGTAGQVLTSNGNAAAPTWQTASTTALTGTGAPTRVATTTAVYIGTISGQPSLTFMNSAAASGSRSWSEWVDTSTNTLKFSVENDNQSTASNWMTVARSGTTATLITQAATGINLAVGTAGLQLNGSAGTAGQVLTSNGASAAPTWQTPSAAASTALNGTSAPLAQAVNGTYAGYGSYAFMRMINAGLGTDNKAIGIYNDPTAGSFNLSFINDALTGQTPFMTVTRSGQNAVLMTMTVPSATFSGTLQATTLNVTGSTAPANGIYLAAANTLAISTASSEVMRFNASNALGFNGANYGTAGQVLSSNGSGAAPTWIDMASTKLAATAATPRSGTVTGVYGGLDGNNDPVMTMTDSRATAGTRVYQLYQVNSGTLNHAFSNDALNLTTPFMSFSRVDATNTMAAMTVTGGQFNFNGQSTGVSNTGGASNFTAAPGGTTAGNGGAMTIAAGSGGTTGSGGQLNLNGGAASTGASAGGGSVVLTAGNGSTNATGGNGGDINLTVGGGGPSATGGNLRLQAAAMNATASSGFVSISTGNAGATSGNSGRIDLLTGSASSGSTGAINIKTGNSSGGGGTGGLAVWTGNATGANNSGGFDFKTGTVNGGTSGAINIVTGNGTSTGDSSTGGLTLFTGNAVGAGTPGSLTIGTGTSATAVGADLVLRSGATTDTSTGAGHVFIRTNTTNAALSLFKSGKYVFGSATQQNDVLAAFGPATEASSKQYLFTIADNTTAVDGTSRVARKLQIYTTTADNALTFYSTANHISSLNGQNSLNPIAFVAHSLSSSGGSWSDFEICRMIPFHATANGGSGQNSALLVGSQTHSQLGTLQVLAPSSAGVADLAGVGHSYSRIRSTQTNSLASLVFQNATTGSAAPSSATPDGFLVGLKGSNVDGQIWNYESGYISFGTNNTEVLRMNAANMAPATTGTYALGTTALRYSTAYFSAAIDTSSDVNLKQDIEELEEAELAVALKVKKLVRKYRLKADVAQHADAAKIQFGVIAQDVWAAFESEGLDASKYNVVKKNTWYELDGEVVSEGTEGAVEVMQMSVSYEQLSIFMIAAL